MALPGKEPWKVTNLLAWGFAGSGIFATLAILYLGLQIDPTHLPSQLIGKNSPEIEASWVQGQDILGKGTGDTFRLSTFRGKKIVLNFWASWCVSCRQEARELEAFWRRNKEKTAVVGIAIQDEKDAALQFAQQFGKTYVLGLDKSGNAALDYGVTGVPETFFIDENGVVIFKKTGPLTLAELEEWLNRP